MARSFHITWAFIWWLYISFYILRYQTSRESETEMWVQVHVYCLVTFCRRHQRPFDTMPYSELIYELLSSSFSTKWCEIIIFFLSILFIRLPHRIWQTVGSHSVFFPLLCDISLTPFPFVQSVSLGWYTVIFLIRNYIRFLYFKRYEYKIVSAEVFEVFQRNMVREAKKERACRCI